MVLLAIVIWRFLCFSWPLRVTPSTFVLKLEISVVLISCVLWRWQVLALQKARVAFVGCVHLPGSLQELLLLFLVLHIKLMLTAILACAVAGGGASGGCRGLRGCADVSGASQEGLHIPDRLLLPQAPKQVQDRPLGCPSEHTPSATNCLNPCRPADSPSASPPGNVFSQRCVKAALGPGQ